MRRSIRRMSVVLGSIFLASICVADSPTTKPGTLLQDPNLQQLSIVWEASAQEGASVSIENDPKATPAAMLIKVDKVTPPTGALKCSRPG